MMKLKKTCCLLLALVMALGLLSACGGGDGPVNTPAPEYGYVAKYTELDGEFEGISSPNIVGERLYFMTNIEDGVITESYQSHDENGNPMFDENGEPVMEEYSYPNYVSAVYSVDLDGADAQRVSGYTPTEIPEGAQGGSWINSFKVAPNGELVFVENVYYSIEGGEGGEGGGTDVGVATGTDLAVTDIAIDVPATEPGYSYDYHEAYLLRIFDQSGKERLNLDLKQFAPEGADYFYVSDIAVDAEGNICLNASERLIGLDSSGKELYCIDFSNGGASGIDGIMRMVSLADGSIGVLVYTDDYSKTELRSIDAAAGKIADEGIELGSSVYQLYPGTADYDFCYNRGESFFGFDAETGTDTKLLTWLNCDVDGNNLAGVFPQENGDVLCCTTEYTGEGSTNYLIRLVKTPYDQIPQKTTLTLACNYLDYSVRSELLKFNRMSETCRIEVRDYSEFNTDDNYSAGLTQLVTEIGAGAVPDILLTSGMPMEALSAKGYFTDLWQLIDADTELGGREALYQPFLNAISEDGKLYWITNNFQLQTLAGHSSVVGTEPGWSYAELMAALDKMPEGCEVFSVGTTKADIFSAFCQLNLSNFVDWGTGECSFDSEAFIGLLKFTDNFPAKFDWENYEWTQDDGDETRIKEGRQLLMSVSIGSPYEIVYYKSAFDGNMSLIGFPDVPGSGAVFSSYSPGFAISETCKDRDAAWSFVRTFLTQEYQENNGYYGFAVNKAVFDKYFEQALSEEYNMGYVYRDGGEETKTYTFTEADRDMLLDVIENTAVFMDTSSGSNDQLTQIVNEEASYYFSGEKSAEDVAATIQNRASIYVNEQR